MTNRLFTLFVGLVFLGFGICILIPSLVSPPPADVVQPVTMHFHFGYLFSMLPVNLVTAVLFLIAGVAGIAAAGNLRLSRTYEKIICLGSVALFFIGLLPLGTSRLWGILPLYSWTDLFFLIIALFTFYFAFVDGPDPIFSQPI